MTNKILSLALLLCSIAITSCNNTNSESEQQARLDSIRQAEALRLEMMKQDSIEAINFTTPDLKTFFLHAHVKHVVSKVSENFYCDNMKFENFVLDYDVNGNLTKHSQAKIIRDKTNRVSILQFRDKEFDYTYYYKIKYNSDGYPIKFINWCLEGNCAWDGGEMNEFNFEKHNDTYGPTLITRDGEEWGYDKKIEYLEFDSYGNWTKKICAARFYDVDESIDGTKKTQIVTREITYYTPEEVKSGKSIQAQPQPVQQQTVNAKSSNPSRHKATIKDPDGFTNIRRGASVNSDIVGKIYEGETFYYEVVPGSNWRKVYQNDNFLGYIYYNRIVKL